MIKAEASHSSGYSMSANLETRRYAFESHAPDLHRQIRNYFEHALYTINLMYPELSNIMKDAVFVHLD